MGGGGLAGGGVIVGVVGDPGQPDWQHVPQ